MAERLPAKADALTKPEVLRLAKLESKVDQAVTAAGRIAGEALAAIRDERLYRLTHSSFESYVMERWGFSRATAYRMIDQAKPPAAFAGISASASAKEQVSVSHGETVGGSAASEPVVIPVASTEAPAKSSEGVGQQPSSQQEPARTGDGTSGLPTEPTPSDSHFARDEAEDLGSRVPTLAEQIETLHDQMDDLDPVEAFDAETEDQRLRHAAWIKRYVDRSRETSIETPKRRQGTISRPADRAKLAVVKDEKIDPALCEHPREKRRKLGYMTVCDDCGAKVA